jgi:formiminoglutamate deiminase
MGPGNKLAMTSLWFETALLPDGWARSVRIEHADGAITAVTPDRPPEPGDERGAIAVPGLANLHSHAFQRGMAGLAETGGRDGDDFWTWRDLMYRFVDRLDPDEVEAIAAQAYVEMLESGFTRVGEFHYLHHDPAGLSYADPAEMASRIAAAAASTGIGLTLLPVFYAHSDFGGAPPGEAQRRFIHAPESFARLLEASRVAVGGLADAVVGLAPHSLRAATPEELAAIIPLAAEGPIHIHIAEQMREVEGCLAWSGERPVAWLLDHAEVDDRWCLVHATHMSAEETKDLAASGAVAGLCPITEANLGDGLFPAQAFLGAGGRFGVGSDSNVLIDVAEELRTLEYGQRLAKRARGLLGSEVRPSVGGTLFSGALAGGAQALGLKAAGLAAGASLDLISLNADHPAMAGASGDSILDAWVFAARGGATDGVWRRGRKIVTGGRHHDRDEIARAYRRVIARVLSL